MKTTLSVLVFLGCFCALAPAGEKPAAHAGMSFAQAPPDLAERMGLRPLTQVRKFYAPAKGEEEEPPEARQPWDVKFGKIDWFNGFVEAEGIGFPWPPEMKHPAAVPGQQKAMAARAAQTDALRNVLAMLQGINLNGRVTVEGHAFKEGVVELEGFIRGHEWVSEKWFKEKDVHYCKCAVRVPLWGVESLTARVYDTGLQGFNASAKPLPESAADAMENFTPEDYIVVDTRGLKTEPVLFPFFTDDKGKVIYSVSNVSRKTCVKGGLVRYAVVEERSSGQWSSTSPRRDVFRLLLAQAQAQETRPAQSAPVEKKVKPRLVVKAAGGSPGKVVLGREAAEKLAADPRSKELLNAGRVIVITDSRVAGIEGFLQKPADRMLAAK